LPGLVESLSLSLVSYLVASVVGGAIAAVIVHYLAKEPDTATHAVGAFGPE
jgi:hypothetical protein